MHRLLKKIQGLRHRFGGEPHSGWLPSGADTPLPTPVEEVLVELKIVEDSGGYLFVCRASNKERCFDCWYETLKQALEHGLDEFGIAPADWDDVT